jgi:hypothetical protein
MGSKTLCVSPFVSNDTKKHRFQIRYRDPLARSKRVMVCLAHHCFTDIYYNDYVPCGFSRRNFVDYVVYL